MRAQKNDIILIIRWNRHKWLQLFGKIGPHDGPPKEHYGRSNIAYEQIAAAINSEDMRMQGAAMHLNGKHVLEGPPITPNI